MAWSTPRTWVTNEVISASIMNTHVRDQLLETAPAKVTTANDIVYATGPNALARLGRGRVIDDGPGNYYHIIKQSDESVTSSTTLQNDNELILPIAANEKWFVEFFLLLDMSASGLPDFKVEMTAPTGASGGWLLVGEVAGATDSYILGRSFGGSGTVHDTQSAYQPGPVLRAVVDNGVNAGNLTLQWAQGTSNANPTTVKAGSFMRCLRLA